MSSDASAYAKETSEQDVEVQQELQIVGERQPAVEVEVDAELIQENVTEPENADSAAAADASDLPSGKDAKDQASRPADAVIAGTGLEDSQESSISAGDSGTESQLSGAARFLSTQVSQESSASVGDSGTESLQGYGNAKRLKLLGIIGVPRRDSPVGAEAGSSSASGTYETALDGDSSSRASLKSGATGEISNSSVSPESSVKEAGSLEGTAAPAPPLSTSGQGDQPRRREISLLQNAGGETQEEVGRNYEQCLRGCASACDLLRYCTRCIRNSKIYIILSRSILLLVALSAVSMGVQYHNLCPKKCALPAFFILMGVSGIFLLFFALVSSFRPSFYRNANGWVFKGAILIIAIVFLWMFVDVITLTYYSPPSFDRSDGKNYCHAVFYNYAYYFNIVIVGLIVLSIFLYIPAINDNTQGYEQL